MLVWHVSFLFSIHRLCACVWGILLGGLFWMREKEGEPFYLQLEFFYLQSTYVLTYNISNKTPIVRKKSTAVSKEAQL